MGSANTVNTPFHVLFARSNTISPLLSSDSTTAVLTSALTMRGDQVSGYHNEDDVYCTVINLEVLLLDGWLCQHCQVTRGYC